MSDDAERLETRLADNQRLRDVKTLLEPASPDPRSNEALERISRLAAALLGTPVALVSLVTDDRQVFAAQTGVAEEWAAGTPLSHSFCQHVVGDDEPLVVSDARLDERLKDNLAIPDLGVIAYCGVPLRSPSGHVVGSFCVIDDEPRNWTDEEVALVADLAGLAATELVRRAGIVAGAGRELVQEARRSLRAVLGGFRTLAAAGNLEHSDRAMYVAVVEREATHLEELLDRLLSDRIG